MLKHLFSARQSPDIALTPEKSFLLLLGLFSSAWVYYLLGLAWLKLPLYQLRV